MFILKGQHGNVSLNKQVGHTHRNWATEDLPALWRVPLGRWGLRGQARERTAATESARDCLGGRAVPGQCPLLCWPQSSRFSQSGLRAHAPALGCRRGRTGRQRISILLEGSSTASGSYRHQARLLVGTAVPWGQGLLRTATQHILGTQWVTILPTSTLRRAAYLPPNPSPRRHMPQAQ